MSKPITSVSGFQGRLFLMIVMVVTAITAIGALLAQRYLSRTYEEELHKSIQQKVDAAAHTRLVRQTVLAGICGELARQPRIHAALEDNALDLLYPSAANELRQIMRERSSPLRTTEGTNIRARFYRFLDLKGKTIEPADPEQHGRLSAEEEKQLHLDGILNQQQIGYLTVEDGDSSQKIIEVIAVPIVSNETFQPIAVLVVGFPFDVKGDFAPEENLEVGISVNGQLVMPTIEPEFLDSVRAKIRKYISNVEVNEQSTIGLRDTEYRLLLRLLNADSAYPPVHEIFLSSMAPLQARQSLARNRIFLTAIAILVIGFIAAHLTARRLSGPVEQLAVASKKEHQQRIDAEEALDSTSRELERAARFSADASHQLKTPVTVVSAGLEELLVDTELPMHLRNEVRSLIGHTGRLTHVIEDLLLLSRMDAGRLEVSLKPENLRLIIDGLIDDLSILPESEKLQIEVKSNDPVWIEGNRSYTSLILQTLLENAWKYNSPGGRIRVVVEQEGSRTVCRVGNTGSEIALEKRPFIFDRFHRGSSAENVPGYGLGLNLAAELTRLHGGSLELISSGNNWTEFKLALSSAQSSTTGEDQST